MIFLYRKIMVLAVVIKAAATRVIVTKAVAAVVNKAETQDLVVAVMTRMIRVIAIKAVMIKVVLAVVKVVLGARQRITGKHSPKPAADYTYQNTSSCMRCFMRYNKQYGRI